MKKVFSLILALVMLSGVFSLSVQGATYRDNFPNTHHNTGKNIADFIAVAKTQIGYTELSTSTGKPLSPGQDGGYTKYGAWFGAPTTAWCAFFVAWCANQAGISTSILPRIGNCAAMVNWYTQRGRYYHKNGFAPKAGDLVFFNWKGGSTAKHIGIVTGVSGNSVYTIEGNTGSSTGYRAEAKTRKLSASYIIGYARPAFNDSASYVGSHSFTAYAASKYSSASSGNYGSGSYSTTSTLSVITGTAAKVTAHGATLQGRIVNNSSYNVTSSGFYFGKDEKSLKKYKTNSSTSKNNFTLSLELEGLEVNKTYCYRSYAVIKGKTYKGPLYSFSTVDDRPSSIVLSESYITVGIGKTNEIFCAVLPVNANSDDVIWSSSNEMVAVAENGIVRGVGAGNSVITVKSDYGGVSASCNVVVTLAPVKEVFTHNASENEIYLTWEDENLHDIVGYEIYRSESIDGEIVPIGKSDKKEYLDKKLEPGKTYYYKIRCLSVEEEFNSELSKITGEKATLPAPVITSVEQEGVTSIINWSAVEKSEKYLVFRSGEKNGSYTLLGESYGCSFSDTSIKNNSVYYYKVMAVNEKCQSNVSQPCKFGTVDPQINIFGFNSKMGAVFQRQLP